MRTEAYLHDAVCFLDKTVTCADARAVYKVAHFDEHQTTGASHFMQPAAVLSAGRLCASLLMSPREILNSKCHSGVSARPPRLVIVYSPPASCL